ncbi:MAG: TlyA family RNA methyltransferase [Bdellovibrionales bacterium]
MRLDQWLVENNWVDSKTKAQAVIKAGKVKVKSSAWGHNDFKVVMKPSFDVDPSENLEVQVLPSEETRFVSRAGVKLESALKYLQLDVSGQTFLDVGQSTGGFTEALMVAGAGKVIGIDVGHDQLHDKIKKMDCVESYEGINAKNLEELLQCEAIDAEKFQGVVMDVSFISQTLIVSNLYKLIAPGGFLLALVKPQFELEKNALDKNGVVKDDNAYEKVQNKIVDTYRASGFEVRDYFVSSILGGEGNKEFFVFAIKN